jgi:tetratricopeptide (TPR) repeat protein
VSCAIGCFCWSVEAAAVVGREFDVDVVAETADLTRSDCLAALDDAFWGGLVSSVGDGLHWRFVHMVAGETIYDGLAPGHRAKLHVAVARTLQKRFADAPDRAAGTVAEHYRKGLAAAVPQEAFEALIAAAEAAERSFSFEEAAEHRETALEILGRVVPADPRVRFETLLSLTTTLGLLGARERRLDAGRRALEVARELGAREVARAAIAFYDVKQWGMADEPEVKAILEEALAGLPAEPSPERAHLTALRAHVNLYAGVDEARNEARRAVEMARPYGGAELREALYIQHHVMGGPDGFAVRERAARDLAALLDGGAASETAVIAFVDTATDQLARGDRESADYWHQMAVSASGTPPFPAMQWYLAVYDAGIAHLSGDYDEGDRLSLEALALGTRIEQPVAPVTRAAHMMIFSDARGDPGHAADLVELVLKQVEIGVVAFAASAGAQFCMRAGRAERAAEIVTSLSSDAFRGVPRDLGWIATMVQLAFATAALGRDEWASQIDVLLEPLDSFHGVVPGALLYRGSVAGARGRLLEVLGRREEAAAAYRRAIAGERALGALPWAEANEKRLAGLSG